ncbi:MAG: carbohydrate kinase family protein [Thermoguttaceae bacterium]|jgi:fructokinase
MSTNSSTEERPRIVAFGEILWDMLPTGPRLGGAPFNFLYHARVLGAEIQALTRVGNDQLGLDVLRQLKEIGVPDDFVQVSPDAPTGVVDVTLDANGAPTYKIVEGVAWDEIKIDDSIATKTLKFLSGSSKSAFYFGSLALRSPGNRESIDRVISQLPSNVMKVCDLNIRAPFYSKKVVQFLLNSSDVFKLNDEEAVILDALFVDEVPSPLSALADTKKGLGASIVDNKGATDRILARWAESWIERFRLKAIILTCGAHGAYLFNEGRASYAPSIPVKVADSVGAGDSFSAVCVVGLLQGVDDQKIVEAASRRAAFVCTQPGAITTIDPSEANPFRV